MPRIAWVGSVNIDIYAGDHPPPHFHARNSDGTEAVIQIESLKIIHSDLSSKALSLVLEWAKSHQELLRINWQLMLLRDLEMTQFRYIRKVTPLARRTLALGVERWVYVQEGHERFNQKPGRFCPLADPGVFAKVSVINNCRAIQWTDEIDYCADALWLETHSQEETQKPRRLAAAG